MCIYYLSPSHFVFETRYTVCLKRHISGVHVSPDSAETLARRAGITNRILSQPHLCQKLLKSVDLHRSYSVLHPRVDFWDTVYFILRSLIDLMLTLDAATVFCKRKIFGDRFASVGWTETSIHRSSRISICKCESRGTRMRLPVSRLATFKNCTTVV